MMTPSNSHLAHPPLQCHASETVPSCGIDEFAFNSNSDSAGRGSPLSYPVPISDHESIVHVRIVDKGKKIRNAWKVVSNRGHVPRGQRYVDADLWLAAKQITDEHGKVHNVLERNGLFTNSELQSPKYIQYRDRGRKEVDAKTGQVIWPNSVEDAFQIAIREIRPMGKKKVKKRSTADSARSESFGRNELIGMRIQQLTGECRKRKQISSHIQVLKKLMLPDSDWLEYVTNPKHSDASRSPFYRYFDPNTRRLVTDHPDPYFDNLSWDMSLEKGKFISKLPVPSTMLGYPHEPQKPTIQRIQLEMNIHVPILSGHKPRYEICHNYTRIQSETGARPTTLEEVRGLISKFTEFNPDEPDQLDCEFVLLDATFDITDQRPPKNSRLGIDFNLFISSSTRYTNWRYETRFYEKGISKKQHSAGLDDSGSYGTEIRLNIPLESSWWVDVFSKISDRRCEKLASSNQQEIQQEEKNARRYLRELTVTQQISATNTSNQKSRRFAVLLWSFGQTRQGEAAVTTWRRIYQPSKSPDVNFLQSCSSYDNPATLVSSTGSLWEAWPQAYGPNAAAPIGLDATNAYSTAGNVSTASSTPSVNELMATEHEMDYGSLAKQSYTSFPNHVPSQSYDRHPEPSFEFQPALISQFVESGLPLPYGLDDYPHRNNGHEELVGHDYIKTELESSPQSSSNYFTQDDASQEDKGSFYQGLNTMHHEIEDFVGGNIQLRFDTESNSTDYYSSSSVSSAAGLKGPYYNHYQNPSHYRYSSDRLSLYEEAAEAKACHRFPQQFQRLQIESPRPLRPAAGFLGDAKYLQSTLDGFGDSSRQGEIRKHDESPVKNGRVLGEVSLDVDPTDFASS